MAKQIKSCSNCRHEEENYFSELCKSWNPKGECTSWKSKRGRKKGSKFKKGHSKCGPKPLPPGERKEHLNLHVKGKTIKAWGGKKAAQTEAENHLETKSK